MQTITEETQSQWQENNVSNVSEEDKQCYERVPARQRPAWAGELLAHAATKIVRTPEIENVIKIACNPLPGSWYVADEAFAAIRQLTLQAQEPLLKSVLLLAENVAKVTYNAYLEMMDKIFYNLNVPSASFEQNTGWQIAGNVRDICAKVNEPEFTAKAEALLNRK